MSRPDLERRVQEAVEKALAQAAEGAAKPAPFTFRQAVRWLAFAGLGCGLLTFSCVGLTVYASLKGIHEHPLVTQALARARADARVKAALGEPIEEGLMPWGKVGAGTPRTGPAALDLSFKVSGPRGKGHLHVSGRREGGVWILSTVSIETDRNERIRIFPG